MAGYRSFKSASIFAALVPLLAVFIYQVADSEWYAVFTLPTLQKIDKDRHVMSFHAVGMQQLRPRSYEKVLLAVG